jgi:hypothetical protein
MFKPDRNMVVGITTIILGGFILQVLNSSDIYPCAAETFFVDEGRDKGPYILCA